MIKDIEERLEEIKSKVKNHNEHKLLGYYDERDLPHIFEDIEYLLSLVKKQREAFKEMNTALERMSKGQFHAPMELSQIEAYQAYAKSLLERNMEALKV